MEEKKEKVGEVVKVVLSSEPQWCAVKNCLNETEATFKRG